LGSFVQENYSLGNGNDSAAGGRKVSAMKSTLKKPILSLEEEEAKIQALGTENVKKLTPRRAISQRKNTKKEKRRPNFH